MSAVSALLEPTLMLLLKFVQHALVAPLPPMLVLLPPVLAPRALLEPSPLLAPLIAVLVNLECELSLFKLISIWSSLLLLLYEL